MSQHCIVCGKRLGPDFIEVGLYADSTSITPEVVRKTCEEQCAIRAGAGTPTVRYSASGSIANRWITNHAPAEKGKQ
jgi:hypothetical protein